MNVSFVVLGVAMIAGSALIYCSGTSTRSRAIGFSSMAIGGMGAVMVGCFREQQSGAARDRCRPFHFWWKYWRSGAGLRLGDTRGDASFHLVERARWRFYR